MGSVGPPGRPRVVRQQFWRLMAAGVMLEPAALACGVSMPTATAWFTDGGGMPCVSLEPLSGRYLCMREREEIAIRRAAGAGVREIALQLGRSPSTISRELRRNASTRSGGFTYRASAAQWHAERRSRRPKVAKLVVDQRLRAYVQNRLSGDCEDLPPPLERARAIRSRRRKRPMPAKAGCWSPQQIANRLPVDFPEDRSMRISHEAIYQSLYVQGRGALRRELVTCLRTGRALRQPRARRDRRQRRTYVTPDILISERPAEAEDRAIPGHWEGDLIIGTPGAIGTLVERTTRFAVLLHLPRLAEAGPDVRRPAWAGHGADAVREAIGATIGSLPAQLRRSLTWDQGNEMAQHARLRIDNQLDVYFCDPHSPWQRGTNENTNGLLRQYFPRGTDFGQFDQEHLDDVAATLNSRPRKTLQWKTPGEAFDQLLASAQTATGVATTS
jgi:IS30 family transposase